MNTVISQSPAKEAIDKIKSRLLIPNNCKMFTVPKVNPEIWSHLPPKARATDVKMQITQQSHSKSLVAFTKIANSIAKSSKSLPAGFSEEILKTCLDGASFSAIAFRDASQKRKQLLKPVLSPAYAGICSSKVQSNEYLFGDNLQEALKASKTANDIVKRATFTPQFSGYKSQGPRMPLNFRGQPRMTYRGAFRGRPFQQYRSRFPQQNHYRQKSQQ